MPVLISRLFLCRSCKNALGLQFIHKRTLKKKPEPTRIQKFGVRVVVGSLFMIGVTYYTVKMASHMYYGTGPWGYIRGFFTKPPPEPPNMENIQIDSAAIKDFVAKEKENMKSYGSNW